MDLFLCNNLSAESLLISSLRGNLLLCGDLLLELSLARLCDFVFLWNRIKVVIVRFCDSRMAYATKEASFGGIYRQMVTT